MRKAIGLALWAGFLALTLSSAGAAEQEKSFLFKKPAKNLKSAVVQKPRFAVPRNPNDLILRIPRAPELLDPQDTKSLRRTEQEAPLR